MDRWSDIAHRPKARVQFPDSPTPSTEESTMPDKPESPYSAEKLKNLQKYREHLNDMAIRLEGEFPLPDTLPYDEDLL